MRCFSVYFPLTLVIFSSGSLVYGATWTGKVEDILPSGYNSQEPPRPNGGPAIVNTTVAVLSFRSVKESEMSLGIDIFLHQTWRDDRLLWPKDRAPEKLLRFDGKAKDILWIPDVYFKNSKSGSVLGAIQDTIYFTVSNETVFMAARLFLELNCDMDFEKYPFDTQICSLEIMSLSNPIDLVELRWKAFRMTTNLHLSEYNITHVQKTTQTKIYKGVGEFSFLKATLTMQRSVGKYLIKRFIPTFLVVVLTFVGFWIPTDISARVGLVITALLALIADQFQSEDLNVSYVYALAVWSLGCICFVFATFIEFAIAISWKKWDSFRSELTGNVYPTKFERTNCCTKAVSLSCCAFQCDNPIDLYARILFPLAYGAFIVTYVIMYCV